MGLLNNGNKIKRFIFLPSVYAILSRDLAAPATHPKEFFSLLPLSPFSYRMLFLRLLFPSRALNSYKNNIPQCALVWAMKTMQHTAHGGNKRQSTPVKQKEAAEGGGGWGWSYSDDGLSDER